MGKLMYLVLCFLIAFIVIGQLPAAAAYVRKDHSLEEEIEASGRNNEEASGASTGVTAQKKFVRNDVPWATGQFRKILKDPDEGPLDCRPYTLQCDDDAQLCGAPAICQCIPSRQPTCVDGRYYQ